MITLGQTYTSKKFGAASVISIESKQRVGIRFELTGHETVITERSLIAESFKDPFFPLINGVGFFGVGRHKSKVGCVINKAYTAWKGMLDRCYNENYRHQWPSYAECDVDEEWHNFQTFADWYELNYVEGFEIDKDIKVIGNKKYGPKYCSFVSKAENIVHSSAKLFTFISPSGEKVDVYNLAEFCRENSLTKSNMSAVNNGRRNSHKGWRSAS